MRDIAFEPSFGDTVEEVAVSLPHRVCVGTAECKVYHPGSQGLDINCDMS